MNIRTAILETDMPALLDTAPAAARVPDGALQVVERWVRKDGIEPF